MLSIQTNVNSLVAQQNLSVNSAFQSKTIQQLTSGYRINSSGDDAAGLAVANKYRSSVAELTQGVANGNDGVAQLQIMDGGMNNIAMVLDRLKTLSTQSASGAFTGNRATLNSEFQTDLGEIDRQAQSIGLNTGGTFAKNLSVYLGSGSGSQNISNAQVNVNLTTATVDTQSLGLKGFQAIAGSADLGSTSATSVSTIVNNAANKAAESTPGTSVMYVSGAGFSDSGKIALSVNLSSVTDTASLATAINAAIQSAGSGTTIAATNFKAANIVASVNTASDGSQQIAFTSSTQAFQVQAGDQMSNALMGNFSTGSTGASLNTSVIGQAAASNATTLASGQVIKVTVTGGGLSAPQTLTINQGSDANVGAAITDLKAQVAANTSLAAAGITVTQNASGQLAFTNSSNQQFNVEAGGDTANLLGLGSYALASGATSAQYTSIQAAANYDKTGVTVTAGANPSPQTTLQFSINGNTAIGIGSIALDAGNATAANYTTAGAYTPTTITNANKAVSFTVDGQTVSGNLSLDTVATSGNTVALNTITSHDSSSTNTNFLLGVDNIAIKNIALTGNDTTENQYISDINTAIVTAFGSAVAVAADDGTGHIKITSATSGTTSQVTVGAGLTNNALGNIGFGSNVQTAGVAAGTTTAAQVATQLQSMITAAALTGGAGATATVNGSGAVVITNTNAGADHTITAPTGGGLAGGAVTTGNNRTGDNLAIAINTAISANSTLAAAGLSASFAANKLTIASNNNTAFRVNAGAAAVKGTSVGTVDLTNGADFSSAPATLSVSVDGAAAQTVTLNQKYATAATLAAAITGQLTGATASVVSLNGKNYLEIANSSGGPSHSIQVKSTGTANAALGFTDNTVESGSNEVNVGFGVSNTSDAGNVGLAAASSALSVVNAGGTTQTGGLTFAGLTTGTQALTIAGNNSSGATQSLTITLAATGSGTASLQNDGSGANIDQAVSYINSQLQKTNNPTLQSVVAVKQSVGGQEEINFVSSLPAFQVGVGTSTNATEGLNAGVAETATASVTGTTANISIDTQAGAQAAISAIGSAIAALGSAQAEVGKGQNQLGYAITLAQSQVTNFSAAESQIRDANVAQQAANLSKAQVLSQASIAAMAQANSAPQAILALLRG